ncbi:zinc finger FYVE domain-containing protein 9-like isoform X1 [Argiope bruennichi]|uniref:zinc finger FYVE domain-containing protein 9-like isoform X1 n=1 Tax=Argiope bruennichi TaxID=94029 RepID=UPI0024949EFC|nr:zinc finger FYVE domain-containing protein 9-like isoform X1 [Argiope bruennichi]
MEKYTIDIDKVLDEFEETEALKVHADKQPDESVIEHCVATNGSVLEERNTDSSWCESKLNSHSSQIDRAVSLDHKSDSDLPLQNEVYKFPGEHLTSNIYSNINSEKKILNASTVSGSFSKTDVLHDDDNDANSKHLSYDIFYKPHESNSYLIDKDPNCQSNGFSPNYVLNDCSSDEILCVSVQEKYSEVISDESQNKDALVVSSESVNSEDFICKEGSIRTNNCDESKSYPGTETDTESVENSEKFCHPYQSKQQDSNQDNSIFSEKDTEQQEYTNNELNNGENCSSLESKYDDFSCPKHVVFSFIEVSAVENSSKEDSSISVTSAEQNIQPVDKCSNLEQPSDIEDHNVKKSESVGQNVVNFDSIDIRDIGDAHVNNLNIENAFNAQDDDSGVSSTEDISGNSPPEVANANSVDCVVNETCDLEGKFLNIKTSRDENIYDLDVSEKFQPTENSIISTASEMINIKENQTETSCITESPFDVGQNLNTCNAFAGARPKLDHSNTDVSGFSCRETSGVKQDDESLNCIETPGIALKSVINEANIDKGTLISEPENLVDSYVSEHSLQASLIIEEKETLNEKTISVDEEGLDNSILEKKSLNGEILENAEEMLSINNKDDFMSPRLQRPTTLDLPSLLSASPETSVNLDHLVSNEPLVQSDSLPVASIVEPSVSEFVPRVKQQPQIGMVKPYWIPDAEAMNCMHCGMKFTVIKRRHHCRGCGKVLCSRCCNQKAYLSYLNKEDRICQPCADILASPLHNEQVPVPFESQSSSSCGSSPNFTPSPQAPSNLGDKGIWRPHPNNPDDYCSTIPPLQQIQSSGPRPPPTVMVPIGVLKRGNKPRREPKQVIFSDGIRPGGDLTDLTEPVDAVPAYRRIGRKRVDKIISGDSKQATLSVSAHQKSRQKKIIISDMEGSLPPVILQSGSENEDKIDWNQIFDKIQDDQQKAVKFALMKNLHLYVKLTKLDCCFGNECWCFTSNGLCTVGQDEVMVVLQRLPEERNIPRDIFKLFTQIYDSASKGSTFDDLGHIIFPEQILGSSDHRGFLFVRPTFQCLSKLTVPNTPYLVAILIHKWEVPWAKVFPLRLMLRMGAECRYYPCALVSVRHRKPVYFEIGQTIMSVLADLRNYQFTIPVIPGLVVHMEEKKTCVNIPRNRYDKVMKVLNSNNVEHVLALGSNFSTEADSHLVCMQKEEGDYQTQAINIENTTRRVTGASFIVFSGALKSTSGLSAKFSIVEDGLLIQIPQETMVNLHMALRDMRDLTIECGPINAADPEEIVIVQWTRDDKKFNMGVHSPIDGKSFEGIPNLRIHTSTDYAGENFLIRWTEVFFLDVDDYGSSIQNELVDPCRLAETVAQSCCMALTPYLDQLAEADLLKLGLRVTLDSQRDRVEYDIGSCGKALPAMYMNALDSSLIPVILRLSGSTPSEKLSFELIFHVLIK